MITRMSGDFNAGVRIGMQRYYFLRFLNMFTLNVSSWTVQAGFMSHYDTLGIAQGATTAEIRTAYRGLVKIYHPDLNPAADAHDRMLAINEAYEVLSDAGRACIQSRATARNRSAAVSP